MKSDKYIETEEQVSRLVDEWDKHNRLIVAFDFDNTVYDYHNQGITFEIITNQLKQLGMLGCYMICFTSCDDSRYSEIKKHLRYKGIPCHGINVDSDIVPFKGRKIYYNVFYDDRAGLGQVEDVMGQVITERILMLNDLVQDVEQFLGFDRSLDYRTDIIKGERCVITGNKFFTGEGWNVMTKVPTISKKGVQYMLEKHPDFDVSKFPVFEEILKIMI